MRMKRMMMGTTALALGGLLVAGTPSPAQAQLEVSIDGMIRFMVQFAEDDRLVNDGDSESDRGYNFEIESRPNLRVLGTTDTGISYGMRVEFQAATWDTRNVRRAVMFFSGAFGRIELGNDEGAARTMVISPILDARGTGGLDGIIGATLVRDAKLRDSARAAKVTYYTPRVAGVQLGASWVPNDRAFATRRPGDDFEGSYKNQAELGANWVGSFAGVDTRLGAVAVLGRRQDPVDRNLRAWEVGGTAGFMGANFGLTYAHERPGLGATAQGLDTRDRIIRAGVAYAIGPVGVGFNYQYRKPKGGDREDVYVGSADYTLFPGVRLQGDVAYNRTKVSGESNFWSGVAVVRLDF